MRVIRKKIVIFETKILNLSQESTLSVSWASLVVFEAQDRSDNQRPRFLIKLPPTTRKEEEHIL